MVGEQFSEETLANLAQRVRELKAEKAQRDDERFEGLCKMIAKKRDEAVKARRASGIETIWQEDQDYYEGVDQWNRTRIRYSKPYASDAPLVETGSVQAGTQCTEFFNITRQFVDSAAARCGDILLPRGDWNWGTKKTPVGDDAATKVDGAQTVQDEAQQADIALRNAKGEIRIKDWLVETGYDKEYRKCIESAARIGTGVLKGPLPVVRTTKTVSPSGELVIEEKIAPETKFIEPEDLFPEANCGDNIHKGQHIFERGTLSYKELEDLKRLGGEYIETAINKVLKEGPGKGYEEQKKVKGDNDLFEVWYYTGLIDVNDIDLIDSRFTEEIELKTDGEEIEICGCEEKERGKDFQSVVVVLVNDTVIKGNLNPLQDGGFPYDVMCWQKSKGHWAGIGVARQMRVAQKIMLDMGRSLMDNMALSAIPMIAMRQGAVIPENGIMELAKGKLWYLKGDQIRTIQEAIQFLVTPSMQKEIMEIMILAGKMAEDATGVNALLQGEQGQATDTVGGMNLLHKNASSLLRRVARVCDDDVTEPHIKRYYDWLLMYGEPDEKGDLQVEATGSSVLVERELEAMQAQILLQFSADPEFGLNKSAIMRRIVKGWGFEPTEVFYSEEEKQKMAEAAAQQPQPKDPRIEAELIRAEVAKYVADQKAQIDQFRVQSDTDRDAVYSAGVAERNRMTYEAQIEKLMHEERLALLKYANDKEISLADAKVQLTQAVMKIQATKELAAMETTASRLPKPPVEPPGKAKPGKSFTQ